MQVRQNENLPKTICDTCYELLTKVFAFKQTCIKSQNTLLECNITVKSEHNTLVPIEEDSQCENLHDDCENESHNIKTELIESDLCITGKHFHD